MLFKRKTQSLFPFALKVSGFLIMITSFFATIGGLIIGPIIFLVGLFMSFSEAGVIIDFENRKIKEYWGIFLLQFGTWKKLPDFRLVTVVPFTQVYSNNLAMGGAQTTSKESSFRVNLKGVNSRISIVASSGNQKETMKNAEELAERFQLDILDCTGPTNKRIKMVEV